jgi:hypothetical protein
VLAGTCHCGNISVKLPSTPENATSCNCSLCRRHGAVWGYFEIATVKFTGHPEHTQDYIQGDRTLKTVRCATCGCVTHWESLMPESGTRCGINLRIFPPKILDSLRVRRFDGADTWKFLD